MIQLLIKNGVCVNPDGSFTGDIAVKDGQIIQLGRNLQIDAEKTIDAQGKFVLPGVIDTHVHLPWPSSSFDSVDDFHSGSLSAAYGGVTSIIEYVIPDESSRLIPALEKEMEKAKNTSFVDYSFHLIIRKVTEDTLLDMAEAVRRGFTSFKIYTAYAGFQLSDEEILTILKTAADLKTMVCFHAEDGTMINFATRQLEKAGMTTLDHYSQAHPRAADISATQRVITYARHLNARIHIVHINTCEGAKAVEKARRSGLRISGETCPHYLMFTEDVYQTGYPEASYFVLAPAIRGRQDQDYLWQSLGSGGISTIATDHCPYTVEQKTRNGNDFRSVPGGAGGIETSLPILYTYGVRTNRLTINRLVAAMSSSPARLFKLYPRKGLIAIGSDADLVIYDPNGEFVIDANSLHSNSDHTLYEGMKIAGHVDATILRGNVLIENGTLRNPTPRGVLLRRPVYTD